MYQRPIVEGRVFYPGYGPAEAGGVQHKLRPFNVGRNKTKRHVRLMKAVERHVARMERAELVKQVEAAYNREVINAKIRSLINF